MATKVILPKQGLQMTEGTITNWLVKEGGKVVAGQPLFEMETDKLTITIDAECDGTMLKIIRGENEVVPITETIAIVGEPGEDITALLPAGVAAPAAAPAAKAETPVETKVVAAAPAVDLSNIKATKVILPKQGLQMTEGTITKWLVKEGEKVVSGQPLFEMETDKLTITIDAECDGTMLKIVRGENEVVPITETIAIVGEPGTDYSPLLPGAAAVAAAPVAKTETVATPVAAPVATVQRAAGARIFISPRAKKFAMDNNIDYSGIAGSGKDGMIVEQDVKNYMASAPKATPLARKVAEIEGVDLNTVKGTGSHGKICVGDLPTKAAAVATPAAAVEAVAEDKVIPMSGMRKVIANRMRLSLSENAQTNHRMDVDMTNAIALREAFKAAGMKVGYNDIILKCVAKALKEFPLMNSSLTDKGIVLHGNVNIGLAVAVDGGLIVPVIKNVDKKSLSEVAAASVEIVDKARNNKLTQEDYSNGTFSVSSLGMFDIDSFTPIINPPEAGIIGVGKIAKKPVVVNDEIVIRPIMTLSLSFDHRIVDGAPAAQFLKKVKDLLQNPYLLV